MRLLFCSNALISSYLGQDGSDKYHTVINSSHCRAYISAILTISPDRTANQNFHRDVKEANVLNFILPLDEGYDMDFFIQGNVSKIPIDLGEVAMFTNIYHRGTRTLAPRLHIRLEFCKRGVNPSVSFFNFYIFVSKLIVF